MSVQIKTKIDNVISQKLSSELGVDPLTADLLVSRGFLCALDARRYLYPSLEDLPNFKQYHGVEDAISRISDAIENQEKIVVYGDYDCDGVCAVTILSESIKSLGGDVSVYIPNRLEDGYGLSIDTLEKVAEEFFPDLIITVDCGISSYEQIEYCINELGIDVVVTDHHEPPEVLPNCIVVNPHLDTHKGLFSDFCGAGVAFMIVLAMTDLNFASKYLDVVAIATMGDIVSLVEHNRTLVKFGIQKLIKAPSAGIKQLIASLSLGGDVSGYDIAFKIVPRINALGRLGDAKRALALFTESDYFVLDCLVKEMNEENQRRQEICEKIESEAIISARPFLNTAKAIVLYGNWHKGVLGITASKLAERFNRPVILFCLEDGILKGSCRSILGINIYDLLCEFSDYFIQFGGHSQAAGVSMELSKFEEFRNAFLAYLEQNFPDESFIPSFTYDIDVSNKVISREFLNELKLFEPYGQLNPKPVFLSVLGEESFQCGKNNPVHISLQTKFGYTVQGFYKSDLLPLLNSNSKKDCFYSLSLNEFNGRVYSQAILEKVFVSEMPTQDNSNYELISYAKTARFLQKDAQLFQKSELYRIILQEYKDNLYGNITVCYSLETYYELKKLFESNDIPFQTFYSTPTTRNTINAVVYCPKDGFDFDIYSNVFFADKPIAFPEENVFDVYSIDEDSKYLAELKSANLDRSKIGEIYLAIKRLLQNGRHRTVENVFKALFISQSFEQFSLAWQVLEDVGLIEYSSENNYFLVKNNKTELTKSYLYCIIKGNGKLD